MHIKRDSLGRVEIMGEGELEGDEEVGIVPILVAAGASLAAPMVKDALVSAGKGFVSKKVVGYGKSGLRKIGGLFHRGKKRILTPEQKAAKAEQNLYHKAQNVLSKKIMASKPEVDGGLVAQAVRMEMARRGMSVNANRRQKMVDKIVSALRHLKIAVKGPIDVSQSWSVDEYKNLRNQILA